MTDKELELEATNFLRSHGFTKTGRDIKKERVDKKNDPKPNFVWGKRGITFYPKASYHYGCG